MDAAVLRSYDMPLDITELPAPDVTPEGAVVAVEACGICRSDWHAWKGHGEWADDQVSLDSVLGHEPAGRVVAVGAGVKSFSEGDRVVVPFDLGCGSCGRCSSQSGNVCQNGYALGFDPDVPGAFAEQVAVPHAEFNLQRLPDSISFTAAASMGCRFATAFHALSDRAAVTTGEWVAIHGCGGVGLSAVQVAQSRGADVVAVDVADAPLSMAQDLGAHTIDASETDPVAAIKELTTDGADVSIDALGRAETAQNSVRCLRELGRHVQVGLTTATERGTISLPTDWMTRWEIDWLGARGCPPSRYDDLLKAVAEGSLDPGALVTRDVSLEELPDRLAAMDAYETVGIEVLQL
jgi:alcohol dehydrogenase